MASKGEDHSDDEVPLNYKRPFGAGIKRKRIDFVPQSTEPADRPLLQNKSSTSAYDAYMAIVLPHARETKADILSDASTHSDPLKENFRTQHITDEPPQHESTCICEICGLPKSSNNKTNAAPHESSLVHQVRLDHSHPPSSLDRRRKGLAYLESYGWDPDARTGLGITGEGRLFPVRTEMKEDKLGIGARNLPKEEVQKPVRLNGKKLKEVQEKAKKKEAKMRNLMYGRDDVNKHLGIEL